MISLRNSDGRLNKTTKIIGTVCAVGTLLVSLGTAGVKMSRANAWDDELVSTEEKTMKEIERVEEQTSQLIQSLMDQQKRDSCRDIVRELNRLKSKERQEGLSEYDLQYRDQLVADKERICD